MEIRKLFERSTVQTDQTARKPETVFDRSDSADGSAGVSVEPGADRVSISEFSKQLARIAKVVREDEDARQVKISEIKQQIEGGNYQVASADVVNALIGFATDNKDLG